MCVCVCAHVSLDVDKTFRCFHSVIVVFVYRIFLSICEVEMVVVVVVVVVVATVIIS